jgi:hypothetical protein
MANPEHIKILHQGVSAWNKWRVKNPRLIPDLAEADLREANLAMANLGAANLTAANLGAADLHGANLTAANLMWTDLEDSDFTNSLMGLSVFGDNDLAAVKGLDATRHHGPSTIGIDTIYASKGNIPEVFLRGCGVPEDFIVYMRSLVGKAIDFYSCFISYSSKDDDFAQRLHADLQQKGVRCWFAPEDLKIGEKFRTRIDESIRIYDKLMVILSENSIRSPWVEDEVEAALEKERKQSKLALFPIRLDDAVMETERAWAGQPAPHAPHRRLPRLERSRPLPEVVRPVIARPQSVTPPQPGACHGRPAPIHRGPGRARARAGCPCHVS